MRFEKTFGIEKLLFQREQFGRDFGRRNNANSRWVPVVQVNGGMFALVAYLIELTPKARASVQQDRLYVFAGTQRVYAVVRASAVIVKEAHATESDAVQTLARWRKNLIVPEHGSTLRLDLKSFPARSHPSFCNLFLNEHGFLRSCSQKISKVI